MQTQENMSEHGELSRTKDKVIENDESKLVPVTESIRYRKFILHSRLSILIRRRKGTLVAAKCNEAGRRYTIYDRRVTQNKLTHAERQSRRVAIH